MIVKMSLHGEQKMYLWCVEPGTWYRVLCTTWIERKKFGLKLSSSTGTAVECELFLWVHECRPDKRRLN